MINVWDIFDVVILLIDLIHLDNCDTIWNCLHDS